MITRTIITRIGTTIHFIEVGLLSWYCFDGDTVVQCTNTFLSNTMDFTKVKTLVDTIDSSDIIKSPEQIKEIYLS